MIENNMQDLAHKIAHKWYLLSSLKDKLLSLQIVNFYYDLTLPVTKGIDVFFYIFQVFYRNRTTFVIRKNGLAEPETTKKRHLVF